MVRGFLVCPAYPRIDGSCKPNISSVAKKKKAAETRGLGGKHCRASDNGADGIEADLVSGVLDSHCLCGTRGCGFGRVVPGQSRPGADAGCRGDLNEDASLAAFLHVRHDDASG
jgi:hypothetical protein